jgi:hypothetical protein
LRAGITAHYLSLPYLEVLVSFNQLVTATGAAALITALDGSQQHNTFSPVVTHADIQQHSQQLWTVHSNSTDVARLLAITAGAAA